MFLCFCNCIKKYIYCKNVPVEVPSKLFFRFFLASASEVIKRFAAIAVSQNLQYTIISNFSCNIISFRTFTKIYTELWGKNGDPGTATISKRELRWNFGIRNEMIL